MDSKQYAHFIFVLGAIGGAVEQLKEQLTEDLEQIKSAIRALPAPDLRSRRLQVIRIQDIESGLSIEGAIKQMQITDSQQCTIEFGQPIDIKGFPAQVEPGSVRFTVGDDSATIEQDATNPFKALVKGVHPAADPLVATVITIAADADLGEGVELITGTEPLLVTSGRARGFGGPTLGPIEEQV